jgi:hypothetical protein
LSLYSNGEYALEVAVVYELGWGGLGEGAGDLGEEGCAFDVAVGAKAGGDAVEVGVVVAGMTAELVGAGGREGAEECGEGGRGELAGGRDGEGAVCGEDGVHADFGLVFEAGAEWIEEFKSEAAEGAAVVERGGPMGFEWVADGADVGGVGYVEQGAGDGGEEVCVFVGVDVGDGDADVLELVDLGSGFAGDVV